jgi:catechol-2,3-dioxygenase
VNRIISDSASFRPQETARHKKQRDAHGICVSEILYPDHGPSGEVYLKDPDGYQLGIIHWRDKEHSEWLKRIG